MPELDDETLATWRAFLNAHARVTRSISAELAAAGLPTSRWYDLLWALRRQPGRSLRVNELAREIVPQPARDEPLRRPPGRRRLRPPRARPDDRRAQRVVLTEAGLDLLRRMWPVYAAGIAAHFAEHLDDDPGKLSATLGADGRQCAPRGAFDGATSGETTSHERASRP